MPSVTVAHFHTLWAELHRRPSQLSTLNSQLEAEWLGRFANRIRCHGCRKHWREVIEKIPPPFHSAIRNPKSEIDPSAYFTWTVRAHNAINRLLHKPLLSLRGARTLWRFDTGKTT